MSVKFISLLFIVAIVFAKNSNAAAQISPAQNSCLRAMLVDQFGQAPLLKLNPKGMVPLKTKGLDSNKAYVWSLQDQRVAIRTSKVESEVVWDPRLFLKDGDGRLPLKNSGQKIPSDDLRKIQILFLTGFARPADMMISKSKVDRFFANSLYDVAVACEGVDDLVLKSGGTLGAAATAAKIRLQNEFPTRFTNSSRRSVTQ
jgi:hypothetical protein